MECLAVPKLPDGPQWVFEIKLDGYRAIAVKSAGKLNLFSRRRNSFNKQYSQLFEALADLPDNTVIDGEVVALNEAGHPEFNLLQHYRMQASRIHYFVFDLLIYQNRDLTRLPFIELQSPGSDIPLKLDSEGTSGMPYFVLNPYQRFLLQDFLPFFGV
jgi:ATP-dependent DNA ligase